MGNLITVERDTALRRFSLWFSASAGLPLTWTVYQEDPAGSDFWNLLESHQTTTPVPTTAAEHFSDDFDLALEAGETYGLVVHSANTVTYQRQATGFGGADTSFGAHAGGFFEAAVGSPPAGEQIENQPAWAAPGTIVTAEQLESDVDNDGYRGCDGDCDDASGATFPDAPDLADDGQDNDCDGHSSTSTSETYCADNGRTGWYPDTTLSEFTAPMEVCHISTNGQALPVVHDGLLLFADSDGVFARSFDDEDGDGVCDGVWADTSVTTYGGAPCVLNGMLYVNTADGLSAYDADGVGDGVIAGVAEWTTATTAALAPSLICDEANQQILGLFGSALTAISTDGLETGSPWTPASSRHLTVVGDNVWYGEDDDVHWSPLSNPLARVSYAVAGFLTEQVVEQAGRATCSDTYTVGVTGSSYGLQSFDENGPAWEDGAVAVSLGPIGPYGNGWMARGIGLQWIDSCAASPSAATVGNASGVVRGMSYLDNAVVTYDSSGRLGAYDPWTTLEFGWSPVTLGTSASEYQCLVAYDDKLVVADNSEILVFGW